MSEPHRCPDCGRATEIFFSLVTGQPATYMVLNDEFIGLSDITSQLTCPSCGWQLTGILRDLVFDLTSNRITAGQFIPADT
jgi:predicted RNA-binding Zn-ribbon protein involved in translation (DUF1610 family)